VPRLEEVKAARGVRPDEEDDMKTKLIALLAALVLPALAWAGSGVEPACPLGCKDCPFGKR
jgi:hypothetical protein